MMNNDFEKWWANTAPKMSNEELVKTLCRIAYSNGTLKSSIKLFDAIDILENNNGDDGGNYDTVRKLEELFYDKK